MLAAAIQPNSGQQREQRKRQGLQGNQHAHLRWRSVQQQYGCQRDRKTADLSTKTGDVVVSQKRRKS
jgi:hypothetical protein